MATARELIRDAYTELGALAVGQALSNEEEQLGLRRLQSLIDAWKTEQGALAVQGRHVFTLPSGTSTFTIGDGGDLDIQRPVYIEGVNYIVPGSTGQTGTVEVPMAPLDNDQYMALSIKDLVSGLPQQFYYSATMPLGTMFVWPTVNQDVDLALYLPQSVDEPLTVNATVLGPPGYREAFLYNLAVRLCGPLTRAIPSTLAAMANSSFLRMQRPNIEPGLLGVDAALTAGTGGAFNVLTGNFTGSSNS